MKSKLTLRIFQIHWSEDRWFRVSQIRYIRLKTKRNHTIRYWRRPSACFLYKWYLAAIRARHNTGMNRPYLTLQAADRKPWRTSNVRYDAPEYVLATYCIQRLRSGQRMPFVWLKRPNKQCILRLLSPSRPLEYVALNTLGLLFKPKSGD